MNGNGNVSVYFVYGLGIGVLIGWLASVVAEITIKGYHTPTALHGLMGIVLGSVFGQHGLKRARRREQERFDEES